MESTSTPQVTSPAESFGRRGTLDRRGAGYTWYASKQRSNHAAPYPDSTQQSDTKKGGASKIRITHPGEALGIIPKLTPHPKKDTLRYQKGDIDTDSIIAFLSHLRATSDMPTEILRVRGRIRNAFPGVACTKPMIEAAYRKAGWNLNELCWLTKREKKAQKSSDQVSKKKYKEILDRCLSAMFQPPRGFIVVTLGRCSFLSTSLQRIVNMVLETDGLAHYTIAEFFL